MSFHILVRLMADTGPPSGAGGPRHPYIAAAIVLALAAAAAMVAARARSGAVRAWSEYARRNDAEFTARGRYSPAAISGKLEGRPFWVETTSSYEDEAPYYHTRASMPAGNPHGIVLGLRRKSMREEAESRGVAPTGWVGDEEFERRFILACNQPGQLAELLDVDCRRELSRYSDVEIYIRSDRLEWRRSGAVSDIEALTRLNALLLALAARLEALPRRVRALSEQLADDTLIEKGV